MIFADAVGNCFFKHVEIIVMKIDIQYSILACSILDGIVNNLLVCAESIEHDENAVFNLNLQGGDEIGLAMNRTDNSLFLEYLESLYHRFTCKVVIACQPIDGGQGRSD